MIRSETTGRTTVHAGPAAELAELALEYAEGKHGRIIGAEPHHFAQVADDLLNGFLGLSAGTVQFWPDRRDGTPFQGPSGYRPTAPTVAEI